MGKRRKSFSGIMIEIIEASRFTLDNSIKYTEWLENVISTEGFVPGEIYISFVTDEKLLKMNQEYLNHDFYTDIITFDYTNEKELNGEIFISFERVKDNAKAYKVAEDNEFMRVMVHGILHLMGYGDHTDEEKFEMRLKEEEKMKMFHVEH